MKAKQKTYWWVDMVLFGGFLVAFFLSLTGVDLHQWIGVFGVLLATYHLLAHRDWVDAVSKRIFRTAPGIVRLKFWVDGVMFAGFLLVLGTGLVISTWLNIPLGNYTAWLSIHIIASITTLLALLVKLALHWRWIAKTARETLSQPALPAIKPVNLQAALVEKRSMDRQDFLKVMGVVAGGSLLALISATKSLASLQDGVTNATSQSSTTDSPTWYSNQSDTPQSFGMNLSTKSGCSIQCGNRCSYPGRCHRYTDVDNDNLCDFGECA